MIDNELFVNADTGRVWYAGDDVACLATELNITPADAESYLVYGQDAGQILILFGNEALWRKVLGAKNRISYMRGVIRNQAGRKTTAPAVKQPEAAVAAPVSVKAPAGTAEVPATTPPAPEPTTQPVMIPPVVTAPVTTPPAHNAATRPAQDPETALALAKYWELLKRFRSTRSPGNYA